MCYSKDTKSTLTWLRHQYRCIQLVHHNFFVFNAMAAKLNANNNRYHSVIIRNILISLMVNIFDEIRALKDPTVQRKSHLVKNFA